MPDLPMSVAEARATGTKFYDTGKPCKHGHVAPRRTTTKHCTVCERIRNLMAPAPPANKQREYHGRWRRKARATKGLTYRGKPCRVCGNSERYVTSGECLLKRFHD